MQRYCAYRGDLDGSGIRMVPVDIGDYVRFIDAEAEIEKAREEARKCGHCGSDADTCQSRCLICRNRDRDIIREPVPLERLYLGPTSMLDAKVNELVDAVNELRRKPLRYKFS